MFVRLVADSFLRRPRRQLLTGAALALGMAVATAALSVSLDVGDRLSHEFRSLGANLLVTPQADSLPLEIGGVDYRPVSAGSFLPVNDLPKLKTIFWRNNIVGFSPILQTSISEKSADSAASSAPENNSVPLIGIWVRHPLQLQDGGIFTTGVESTNPWWQVEGNWFNESAEEVVVGATFAKRSAISIGQKIILSSADASASPWTPTVVGLVSTGGPEDDAILAPLEKVQSLAHQPGRYRSLSVSALTKPEDDFGRRNPDSMSAADLERWSCSPYVSSIAYQIRQVLPGADVNVVRRIADGEGRVLTRVRTLLWLVTAAALFAAALAVGASAAASVIERRKEIGLMKALGAGSATVGSLLAAEQLLLALVGGALGYLFGTILARLVGQKIFGVTPDPSLIVFAIVLTLAAGVTLLGSAIPLRRASRYEPAPILRGE